MRVVGLVASGFLALVLVWAGASKLAYPAQVASGFSALGLPGGRLLARVVPVVELGLAVALLAAPVPGALGTLVLLALFSAMLARAVVRGVDAGCGCFGPGSYARRVSWQDLVRNAVLGGVAVVVLLAHAGPGRGVA